MALYKTIKQNGKYVNAPLKRGEAKKFIMKVNKWDERTYEKQYDLLRNKVRTLERFEASHGKQVKKQSTLDILYKEAKAKRREGKDYTPSLTMQRLKGVSSRSSGKTGEYKRPNETLTYMYESITLKQFNGLINHDPKAKEIADTIQDPVKLEKALIDYANKRNDVIKTSKGERAIKNGGAKYGETAGSPDVVVEFDISSYL